MAVLVLTAAASLREVNAHHDPVLEVVVRGDPGIDDRDADPPTGDSANAIKTSPCLLGSGGLGGDSKRWLHHRVGRELAHLRIPAQGVQLASVDLDHAAAAKEGA